MTCPTSSGLTTGLRPVTPAMSRRDVATTANAFIEAFADCFARLETKQAARRIIQVRDSAFRVCYDDAFLDRVENGFQETFLLGQAQKIILNVFRPDSTQALDKLF
jgi:hypothetical protein